MNAMLPKSTLTGNTPAEDQSEVIAFLSDPATHGLADGEVERIETHGALVFLAGSRAYKLKRAVKLSYMDFSTPAKREAACGNEISRNQQTAPEIYLGTEAIVRKPDGTIAFGNQDDSQVLDWVVVMRRFDQADLLDDLARRGALDTALMDPLARTIADYHAHARANRSVDGDEAFARVVTQTIQALSYASDVLGHDRLRRYSGHIVTALNAHSRLLRARASAGHMKLCHGDLHLRNIVLVDGRPTLFDALEFDDNLATTDVLYDLAFLLMDLWHRDLRPHANLCLNSYASRAMTHEDLAGLAAMPMFMATRAAVRAIVSLDRADLATGADREAAYREAREYFDLADAFLAPSQPRLIAVGGYSGSGKTTVAAGLAPLLDRAPGAIHLRSDVERKRMFAAEPTEQLPRQAYSEEVSIRVYRRLCQRADAALKAGTSVIVDAVFLQPHHRRWIEQVAKRRGVPFIGLWLEAPERQLAERVAKRRNDASDADEAVVRMQFATHAAATCWLGIDASAEPAVVIQRASRSVAQIAISN